MVGPNVFLTVQQHIQDEQRRHYPHASGEFSWMLSGITLATKIVAAQIRRAGLVDVVGSAGTSNVQGEVVQKLDLLANQALLTCLGNRGNVGVLASEENEDPVVVLPDPQHGKYVVIFDPLDGSSNIDVNVSVGTIFSIFRREQDPTGNAIRKMTCCSGARSRWRPGMWCTARRRCWSTAPATACTASRSIPRTAPTCSRIRI